MKKVTIEHGKGMAGAEIWAAWLEAMAARMASSLPVCASSMQASARFSPGDA